MNEMVLLPKAVCSNQRYRLLIFIKVQIFCVLLFRGLRFFRNAKYGVPMPVHLYGQLAQHETGRDLLFKSGEVRRLLDMLRNWPLLTDAYEICELKGALYALGHIVTAVDYGRYLHYLNNFKF